MFHSKNTIRRLMETYLRRPSEILHFLPARDSKKFHIISKYFCIFNNKTLASWVAHMTREFLTCYYCSYYSVTVPCQHKKSLKMVLFFLLHDLLHQQICCFLLLFLTEMHLNNIQTKASPKHLFSNIFE